MMRGARLSGGTESEVHAARRELLEQLRTQRRRLLDITHVNDFVGDAAGKFLSFKVDSCFYDRAARAESGGFFDDEDLPPWDTWLCYCVLREGEVPVLVSWVPEQALSAATNGIAVHMADGYAWLDASIVADLATHFARP